MKFRSSRQRPDRQEVFSFVDRRARRDRWFRAVIALSTAALVAGIVVGSAELRSWLFIGVAHLKGLALIGLRADESSRPVTEEEWATRRARQVRRAEESLVKFLDVSPPSMRAFFEAAGMAPGSALNRWGRGDQVFMFSSQVFEEDARGRSYRLRPNTRSVWLRELKMTGGPHGLLLIPDRPEVRKLAVEAGGIVVEESVQNTNSWGLRGPEPNRDAQVRVLVLGDSFMQGMFIGDADAPPAQLERTLAQRWNRSVSVLNTGHVGYSPEQYYYTFLEYAARFRPHFLVISVCHNDFGDDQQVLSGKGDLYGEAAFWLNRIIERCRGVNIGFLLVPVPHQEHVEFTRSNGHYPGRLFDLLTIGPNLADSLLDDFINENLRLKRFEPAKVAGAQGSVLYNQSIKDGHFSALGSAVWADSVGERVALLCDPAKLGRQFFESLEYAPPQ